ncbi:hypothetical protein MPNT_10212 [Candidatus Methylacidithermus pantelleriae]|uniref:Uncharacterized protein n=1 Tax=Candidatus Methylacidithermus pantelleriae TaxID=2744239 RepID=A0A8J2FUZ0_9BACT|nr:hypothetical protein MPNT_10212 [Candidatus Methylacidithermus pantelleriae]
MGLVGVAGFEPATSCSQSKRSYQAELHSEIARASIPKRMWQVKSLGNRPFVGWKHGLFCVMLAVLFYESLH